MRREATRRGAPGAPAWMGQCLLAAVPASRADHADAVCGCSCGTASRSSHADGTPLSSPAITMTCGGDRMTWPPSLGDVATDQVPNQEGHAGGQERRGELAQAARQPRPSGQLGDRGTAGDGASPAITSAGGRRGTVLPWTQFRISFLVRCLRDWSVNRSRMFPTMPSDLRRCRSAARRSVSAFSAAATCFMLGGFGRL